MFRIGEFSKIAQVSGRLLRYYDRVGLFKPVRADPMTGYRYYSASQLTELNRILALKELGLTLDQIRRLVAGKIAPSEIRGMLVMKKAQIEQTVQQELAQVRYIESRINQIENEGVLREYEVVLKSVPIQKFVAARFPSATLAGCRAAVIDVRRLLPAELPPHGQSKGPGPIAMLIHSEIWEAEGMDVEIGFFVGDDSEARYSLRGSHPMVAQTLPQVEMMATTIHMGVPEAGHESYAALGFWAEAHHYRFDTPSREIFIGLPRTEDNDSLVAEIQIPVLPENS